MKHIRILMGMPITIEIVDPQVTSEIFDKIYQFFESIDNKFSTYKTNSEISLINQKKITPKNYSKQMKLIFELAEKTKLETEGYFDIKNKNGIDPSGIVKGWAIYESYKILIKLGFKNFYIDAGGDIQTSGLNNYGKKWNVGIKNPFNQEEIIKILKISGNGVATSGTYIRGQHIYNPNKPSQEISDILSLTVVGPNIYEADRFATAAFAMGKEGINFIEKLTGLEGYMIDKNGVATMTTGFEKYLN